MKIFKNSIVIALVLFLIIHTTCTLFYTLPENLVSFSLKQKSEKYIAALFDQSWALFAPVPEVNKRVYVSYFQNEKWSRWEEPFADYLYAHQSNRMSANAKIVFMISGTLHYLYNENKEKLKTEKNIVGNNSSGYFKVLKNAIKNKLMWQYKENKKIRVLVIYTGANCNQSQTYSIYYPGVEAAK